MQQIIPQNPLELPFINVSYIGVVTFHGSQLAQKAGDRNFTQGNPISVVINNGYLDPSNNASQLASIQARRFLLNAH